MSRPKGAPRALYNGSHASPTTPPTAPQGRTWGRKNLYVCDTCFGAIATEDLHDGVTPMFLACRVDGTENWDDPEKCKGRMQSQMYPRELWPEEFEAHIATAVGAGGRVELRTAKVAVPPVTFEWFRPSPRALRQMSPEMRDHIKRGGLELRKRA